MKATPIKALSLWQPWATLMALGHKRIETRSWSTAYRGWLAIHAAKFWSRDLEAMCGSAPFLSALGPLTKRGVIMHRPVADEPERILPFGAIVALVYVVDCFEIDALNWPRNDREFKLGDYTPGRYQWRTDRVINLGHEAITTPGARGLFTLPLDIERRLCMRIVNFETEDAP